MVTLTCEYWQDVVPVGVEWLRSKYGDRWFDKIDEDRLNLNSDSNCVLAQLEDNTIGFAMGKHGLSWDDLERLGFDKPYDYNGWYTSNTSYGYGNQMWRDTIKALKALTPAS